MKEKKQQDKRERFDLKRKTSFYWDDPEAKNSFHELDSVMNPSNLKSFSKPKSKAPKDII